MGGNEQTEARDRSRGDHRARHPRRTLSGEINLTDAETQIRGDEPDDRFGAAVAPATDVNGDGNNDALVGAPKADENGNDSGTAYLVYGSVDGAENRSLSTAEAKLHGEAAGDRTGVADLSAGDYTVDARFVTDDLFGSGNVTVNGDNEATVSVAACDQPGAVCEGQAKYDVEGGASVNGDVGNDFDKVTVSGGADSVTVANEEAFAVDVYVKAASDQSDGGTFGPFAVGPGESETIDTGDTERFPAERYRHRLRRGRHTELPAVHAAGQRRRRIRRVERCYRTGGERRRVRGPASESERGERVG